MFELADPKVHPDAKQRLMNHTGIILKILQDARDDPLSDGWVAGPRGVLNDVSPRYSARIHELRRAGYEIEMKQNHQTGESWYRLMSEPKEQPDGCTPTPLS